MLMQKLWYKDFGGIQSWHLGSILIEEDLGLRTGCAYAYEKTFLSFLITLVFLIHDPSISKLMVKIHLAVFFAQKHSVRFG